MTAPSGKLVLVDCGLLDRFDASRHSALFSPPLAVSHWTLDFDGVGAIAIGGLTPGSRVEVLATPTAPGSDEWTCVDLEVRPQLAVAKTAVIGTVPVDMARLMFADPQSLLAWKHDDAMDGQADIALWGADGAAVAQQLEMPALDDGTFGWRDMAVDQARAWAEHLGGLRQQGPHRFAFDFRPHSHHYQVMDRVRASPTASASVHIGGAEVCAFMTSVGDGVFPVHAETDRHGSLIRVRVQIGEHAPASLAAPTTQGSPLPSAPQPVAPDVMPPTPQQAAASAVGQAAKDVAQRRAERWVYRQIRPYLPETILKRAEKMVDRKISGLIWSCGFFAAFGCIFGAVFVVFAVVIGMAWMGF